MTKMIDQSGATADGDIVGRDKIEKHYHFNDATPGIVEKLLAKLQAEVEKNEKVRYTIEALAHFHIRQSTDGIEGLEAKLEAGGRSSEYFYALEKKELFVKLLEKWSLYASAQEIFAYFLAKIDYEFNFIIYPRISTLSQIEVNELVRDHVVVPTIDECGSAVFVLNHAVVMGMLYWLAEQCFVRWHK